MKQLLKMMAVILLTVFSVSAFASNERPIKKVNLFKNFSYNVSVAYHCGINCIDYRCFTITYDLSPLGYANVVSSSSVPGQCAPGPNTIVQNMFYPTAYRTEDEEETVKDIIRWIECTSTEQECQIVFVE